MRGLVLGLLVGLVVLFASNSQVATSFTSFNSPERPIVNVPLSLRQANWLGPSQRMPNGSWERSGSCAWATLCNAEQFLGRPDLVRKIKATKSGSTDPRYLAEQMTAMGIPFAMTLGQNDIAFIEKALAGRRGVMVEIDEDTPEENERQIKETGVNETHMVLVTYIDSSKTDDHAVCLLDCNYPRLNRWMSLERFESIWEPVGSWAVVPLGTPVPPLAALPPTK